MNKKAFQLSINFVIIIILSIVIFIFGISFLNQIFTGAEKTREAYYQQFDKQIQDLMCSSLERVCIPKERAVLSRDNIAVFGVGILNVLGSAEDFEISVSFDSAYANNGDLICDNQDESGCGNPSDWPMYIADPFSIENNKQVNHAVVMDVSAAPSGTYIFNVNIQYDSTDYDTTHKLYVEIP